MERMPVFEIFSEDKRQYYPLIRHLHERHELGLKNWLVLYDNGRPESRFLMTQNKENWVFCDRDIDDDIPEENVGINIDLTNKTLEELLVKCPNMFDYITVDGDGDYSIDTMFHFIKALAPGGFFALDKNYLSKVITERFFTNSEKTGFRKIEHFSETFAGSTPLVPGRITDTRTHRLWFHIVRHAYACNIPEAIEIMNELNTVCDGLMITYLMEKSYAFENIYKYEHDETYTKIEEAIKNYEVEHGMDLATITSKRNLEDTYEPPIYLTELKDRLYKQIIEKWHVPNGTEPYDENGKVCLFGPKGFSLKGGKRKTRRHQNKKQRTLKHII